MQTITTIGLNIAKSVFQVHGVDAGGQVIVRRQLKRRYVLTFFQKLSPCIEACASADHWSRELQALGHTGVDGCIIQDTGFEFKSRFRAAFCMGNS
jgi:transposase